MRMFQPCNMLLEVARSLWEVNKCCALMMCSHRAAESPVHASSEMPRTPLLEPCASLARLDPWPFFSAPRGPSLPSSAEIPSPVSVPIAPHPSPAVWVMNLLGSLPQRLGVVDHLGVGGLPCKWGSVAQRRALGNGCRAVPSSTNTPHLFFPLFLNPIWREHKNMHLTRLILLSA